MKSIGRQTPKRVQVTTVLSPTAGHARDAVLCRHLTTFGTVMAVWLGTTGSLLGQDEPAPSVVGFVSVETRPALEVGTTLPHLSELVSSESTWLVEWDASWDEPPSRGRESRRAVYDALDRELLQVKPEAAAEATRSVETAVEAVLAFEGDLPLHLSLSFQEAQRLLARAQTAEAERRWHEAGLLAMKAADAIRELGPRAVALGLIETAETVLSAPTLPDGISAEQVRRARRLVEWARSATRARDYPRAVERAYYACRLAGIILP